MMRKTSATTYFGGVNYGTSHLIKPWANSIRKTCQSGRIILVDNFSSAAEREKCRTICAEESIGLIECGNIGYGSALNEIIEYVTERFPPAPDDLFYIGNIDISFQLISEPRSLSPTAFIPSAMEGKRNRNPFLTSAQRRMLPLHLLSIKLRSPLVLGLSILALKIIGFLPSRTWATHGSLFCFNAATVGKTPIFNRETFLYSEELEFASYMSSIGAPLLVSETTYSHTAHAATGKIIKNRSDFFRIWESSFRNWRSRWS